MTEQFGGILFVDIETVPVQPAYAQLSEPMQAEWERKARLIKNIADTTAGELFEGRAGVYSEFAKIICIGFGTMYNAGGQWKLRLKTISGHNEHEVLTAFVRVVDRMAAMHGEVRFCGHNIREFDIPFICRRLVINGIPLPACLRLSGKKPWEIHHIDTLELWKFGDNKNYTSLSLLACVLGIPSPKGDIDGSQVAEVYWRDGDLERIARYCTGDVLTSAKVWLRLRGGDHIDLIPDYADGGPG